MKKPNWGATPNTKRHRKMTMVTLSPEGLAELDERREGTPRGEFIEWLIKETTPWYRKPYPRAIRKKARR